MKVQETKEKANLYVTALVHLLYKMEELVALQPGEIYDDERYKIIQGNGSVFINDLLNNSLLLGAVRCKFKLTNDQVEQMYSEWLREVFSAKRRVAVAKLKLATRK